MSPIESLPFNEEEHKTEPEVIAQQPVDIVNNMAMVFADQIRKGIVDWEKVPISLRSTVSQLLGGE